MLKPPMQDYLEKYAEPEAREFFAKLSPLMQPTWNAVAVLPLLAEPDAPKTIASLQIAASSSKKSLLVIAVINAKESASPDIHEQNLSILKQLANQPNIFVVDRATPNHYFPEDQGVGLARKIGCDIAIALIAKGHLNCDFIHTTDGDAVVDTNYFIDPGPQLFGGLDPRECVTLWHLYRHEFTATTDQKLQEPHPQLTDTEAKQNLALCLYEISLRYYVLGLRDAGSPFAFPTVGSTQAFTPKAYCEVRGFPRREAGEDFYLVNKLAKLGGVTFSPGFVRLKARPSARVPFGTGAAMRKIGEALSRGEPFPLYHPKIFLWLKDWLKELERFCEHQEVAQSRAILLEQHGENIVALLSDLGAWDAMTVAVKTRPQKSARWRHLHTWFDAFRTLKFVHGARDRFLGWLPYPEALASSHFLPRLQVDDAYDLLNALRQIEEAFYVAPRLSDKNKSIYD